MDLPAMYSRPNVFKHMYLRFQQSNKLQLRKTIHIQAEKNLNSAWIQVTYVLCKIHLYIYVFFCYK